MTQDTAPVMPNPPPEAVALGMADSLLPRFNWDDPNKRAYLTYRMCGFGREEAIKRTGISRSTVYHWRTTDPEFEKFEKTDLLTIRNQFAKSAVGLEFTRNLKLALEIDYKILSKAQTSYAKLTVDEKDYLKRIRPLYTPQQLQALESLFADIGAQGFDELIILARKGLPNGRVQEEAQKQSYSVQAISSPSQLDESEHAEDRSAVQVEEAEILDDQPVNTATAN